MKHLLPLALQALEDDDALRVLGDAVLEAQWYPATLRRFVRARREDWFKMCAEKWHDRNPGERVLLPPNPKVAKALVAFALFGEWSAGRWPLIAAAWVGLGYSLYRDLSRRNRDWHLGPSERVEELARLRAAGFINADELLTRLGVPSVDDASPVADRTSPAASAPSRGQ